MELSKYLLSYDSKESVGKNWQDFSLTDVTVTDLYSASLAQKVVDFIGSYNPDRLLYNFRVAAGLSSSLKVFGPYPGWESGKIGGHTFGHYLAASAQAVAHGYGKCKGKDGRTVEDRLVYIIDSLSECQESYKKHNGFVFGAVLEDGQDPECQFDKLDAKDPKDTWVPWYTMHKIVNGLLEVYKQTGNEKALVIVEKLGEWVFNRVTKWSDDVKDAVLSVEYGGMNDCLYELYKIAKKTGYKDCEHFAVAAHQFDEDKLFEIVKSGVKDALDNKHANTTIPKFMGALNRYLALGDEKYLGYAECFWNLVVNHHTYITGGNSECEFFGKDDILDEERSNTNCETCNTHNMLKLSRELFKITGEHKYADYYEHTYLNAILASGNKYTGMTTYFQPMATGCFKVYCNADLEKNFFWCCSGTGLENFTKLGDSFYYHSDNQLFVSIYSASTLEWKEKGLTLVQKSNLPESNVVTFEVEKADGEELEFVFRIPDWAETFGIKDCNLKIDGLDFSDAVKKGYICLKNNWKTGDKITIEFQQKLKAYTLADSNGHSFAFKYGPAVLAAELGKDDNMILHQVGVQCDVSGNKIVNGECKILDGSYFHTTGIGFLKDETLKLGSVTAEEISENPEKYFTDKSDSDGVAFSLNPENWPSELIFTPYYRVHEQRYGIYWRF